MLELNMFIQLCFAAVIFMNKWIEERNYLISKKEYTYLKI